MFNRHKRKKMWRQVMKNDKKIAELTQELFFCRALKDTAKAEEITKELDSLEFMNEELTEKIRGLL